MKPFTRFIGGLLFFFGGCFFAFGLIRVDEAKIYLLMTIGGAIASVIGAIIQSK
ncbi:MAG: hypothetical protein J6C85_04725 [Alphaproteobacteria bacterium]|nr:hypothetical protein [Alphaproteobacteria bacterium]